MKLHTWVSDRMKCSKCGEENSNDSKFCRNCGEPLKSHETMQKHDNSNHKKIIIVLIALIAVLVIVLGVLASGILTPVAYETQNFEGFSVDVPKGQIYQLSQSFTSNPKNVFLAYINKDKYYFDAWGFQVGNNITRNVIFGDLQSKNGDVEIYKNQSDELTLYMAYKHTKKGSILVYGNNQDMITHIADSFKAEDLSKLAN